MNTQNNQIIREALRMYENSKNNNEERDAMEKFKRETKYARKGMGPSFFLLIFFSFLFLFSQ